MASERPRVLVVEDERVTRRSLRAILDQSGFEVNEAVTGEEGLEQFQRTRPAAVVLDILLPGMDGFAACRQMRQVDPTVAILFLTSKGADGDKLRGFETGADDYMVKPFNPEELVARLRAVLRRCGRPAGNGTDLGSGSIRMDAQTRKWFRGDVELELTPKESALLQLFLKNPGRTLDRETLRQGVWGEKHFGSDKALDVYVRKLREKIEDNPSHPMHLKTAWGIGYIWQPTLEVMP